MLRVGLTGSLASGKSTVAAMLAERGAYVLHADELGREMMRPGQAVYAAIVEHFGARVVGAGGDLDRAELARLAFADGRVEELNAIVHPAVIARQAELSEAIARGDQAAVVVVESALIFETKHGGADGWRSRFDRVILVTAPESLKIARFVERASENEAGLAGGQAALEAEARRRLAQQIDDASKAANSDYVLQNDGSLSDLEAQVNALWPKLIREAGERSRGTPPLQ